MRSRAGWITALVCLVGLGVFSLPVPAVPDRVETPAGLSMVIWRPLFLRAGEAGGLEAEVRLPAAAGKGGTVRALLDLPGLVYGDAQEGEGLGADGSAHFSWTLAQAQPGVYAGRLRVYGPGGELLLAREVEAQVVGPGGGLLAGLRIAFGVGLAEGLLLVGLARRRGDNPIIKL